MTTNAATTVIVYGPNMRFDDGADFHVHRVGCAHLTRRPYAGAATDQGGWTMPASTEADVLDGIYADFDDPQAFGDTVTVFPCAGLAR